MRADVNAINVVAQLKPLVQVGLTSPCSVIPAQSLPSTRSGAGIQWFALRLLLNQHLDSHLHGDDRKMNRYQIHSCLRPYLLRK
jgi:hypothetical protein